MVYSHIFLMECRNKGYKYNICTLTIMYKLFMHSLSLFKIVVPKAINKMLHQHDSLISVVPYSSIPKDKIEHTNVPINPIYYIDTPIKMLIQQKQQQKEEEIDLTKTIASFDNQTSDLQRNLINGRVKSLQYQANNPCEDTLIYSQLKSIKAYTISVFDGHGGPELAQYSKAKITSFIDSFLSQHSKKLSDIGELIKESLKWSYKKIEETFFQIYQQQIKIGNKKMRYVGTCGITAIVYNDRVYIGNAGDSQAIFILGEGEGLIRSQRANNRLSVNNKAERERIMKEWEGIDDQIITQQSSNTYYLKGRLQPTRTIGDYYLKKQEYYPGDNFKGPYLSCIPEIQQHQITKSHKYLIVASDGIWDSLNKNEVMNILMEQKQIDLNKTCYDTEEEQAPHINNIVPHILQKASELSGKSIEELKRMDKGIRRNYHDDITMAVISLQNQSLLIQ